MQAILKNGKFYDPRYAYGGDLLKTRRGRSGPRPLSRDDSIHLVLRSSLAKGPWTFTSKQNRAAIETILTRFGKKHDVAIWKSAVVGNHLHLQIKLGKKHRYRASYNAFVRAITAAIAMAVTGISRWRNFEAAKKFWDRRPFTRIVKGFREHATLQKYIRLNQLEGFGHKRVAALIKLKTDSS